jgi:hypothetical protein
MVDQCEHYTFKGPEFHTRLSPLDQISVYNWSPRILVFPLSLSTSRHEVTAVLLAGMQATVNAFPDLAGSCTQPSQSRPGDTHGGMRYHDKGEAHLRVTDVSDKYSLDTLRASNFDQESLLPEHLCPTPAFAHPAMQPLELFSVQANFIQGGLLLVVCIYHSICDGVGQFHVTEMLANQCRVATAKDDKTRIAFRPDQFDRTMLFEGVFQADIGKLSAYTILSEPARGMPDWASPDHRKLASETFNLSKKALDQLKTDATKQKPVSSNEPYISTHDAVCALIWRTVMAARVAAGEISKHDETTFGMPIDGRSQLKPAQPPDYMGNNAIGFKVANTVESLIAPESLGTAAFAIRTGVKSVDNSYLRNLITLLNDVPDYGQVFLDMLEFIKTTGLFLTSWAKFPYAKLDFGEKFGKCEMFRFPAGGYMNGIAVIFPPLDDGGWEVTLTLEEKCMGAFKNDEVWKQYVQGDR